MNMTVINVITISKFIPVLNQHIINVSFSSGNGEHECGSSLRGSWEHWGKATAVMCVTLKQIQKVTSKFTLHDNIWEKDLTVTNVIIKQPQNKILKRHKDKEHLGITFGNTIWLWRVWL